MMSDAFPGAAFLLAAASVLLLVLPPEFPARVSRRSWHPGPRDAPSGRGRALAQQKTEGRVASALDAASLLELTGAMLTAGVGIEASLKRLADCVPGAEPLEHVYRSLLAGATWEQAWQGMDETLQITPGAKSSRAPFMVRPRKGPTAGDPHRELRVFGEHLAFSHATGAPTAYLLQSAAEGAQIKQRQRAEERAARLGVSMVLPLGVCFLPAFIVLGVIPVVLGLLPGVLQG